MKALEKWLAAVQFRQVKIWVHDRYAPGESGAYEIWWHCDLSEHGFPGFQDYGQRQNAGAWMKQEVVYSGYDKSLAVAIRKAIKRAKQGI